MKTKLIAHRCGTDKYPELTVDSAKHSLYLGADIIEADVRLSKDKKPVISHDADCSRLFGENVKIKDIYADDFANFKYLVNSKYRGIGLGELFKSSASPLLLHIKDENIDFSPVFCEINAYNYEKKIIMGVSTPKALEQCRNNLPHSKTLLFIPSIEDLESALMSKADIIRLWEPWVTQDSVKKIQNTGKQVWVMSGQPKVGNAGYTTEENFKKWLDLKVDGILINEIEFARKITDNF